MNIDTFESRRDAFHSWILKKSAYYFQRQNISWNIKLNMCTAQIKKNASWFLCYFVAMQNN